jgi:hypothetical protein
MQAHALTDAQVTFENIHPAVNHYHLQLVLN